MPSTSPLVSRLLPPLTLAGGAGAGVRWITEIHGAHPGALATGLAAAAAGGALAAVLPHPKRRWLAPLIAAIGASAVAASAGVPRPGPILFTAIAGAGWILSVARAGAGRAGIVTAAVWLLAAAVFVGGAIWPLPFAALSLAGVAVGAARLPTIKGGDAPILGAIEAGAVVAAGAALATASWAAGRPSLDPSPFGFVGAVAVCVAAAGVAAPFAPRAAITLWPTAGIAALLTPALLAGLPGLTMERIVPLAGSGDPRQVIAALGALLVLPGGLLIGLAWPRASRSRAGLAPALAGLAAGLLLGIDSGPATWSHALWLATAAGALALLRGGGRARRALGLAVAVAAVSARAGTAPLPEIELLTGWTYQLRDGRGPDRAAHLQKQLTPLVGGWGPGGAALIQRDEREQLVLRLDGLPLEYSSRAADTERMVGHLAGALAQGGRQAMVIGDDLGLVTEGLLTQGFDQIDIAVPDVEGLRGLASVRPAINETQLNPAVRHIRESANVQLRRGPARDAIVEVARTPWADAHQSLPGEWHLSLRASVLNDGGVYLLVVPSLWMESAQLRGLVGDFVDVFPAAWMFLPPVGADQLILAGWTAERKVPWAEAQGALQQGAADLAELQVRSALDLADRAIVDRQGLLALASDDRARLPWLGGVLHRLPRMNLPLFKDEIDTAADLFDVGEEVALRLENRAVCNREFVLLLEAASGGALDKVFETGRALSERSCGNRSVETVITSGLERAREQLARGWAEGPSSPAWSRAIQELQGALLIAPRSPEALTLLGEAYYAQGNLGRARTQFEKALEEDEAYMPALHWLAQVEMDSNNYKAAEVLYRRAAERYPDSWLAAFKLGSFLLRTGRDDEAERMLKRSSALDPKQYQPHLALGDLYISKGQDQQVIIQGEQAVAIEENAHTLTLRGQGYLRVQQYDAAERNFNKAILNDSSFWQARLSLCLTYGAQQRYSDAIAAAEQGLLIKPGDANLQQCVKMAETNLAPPQEN